MFDFLKSFKKNKYFKIKFIEKNKKVVANFYLKDNYLDALFGKRLKQPFALYIGVSHITFYFRTKQESLTKNIEQLNLDFTKPLNKDDGGDYYVKIYNQNEIEKLLNFVFNKKLNLKLSWHLNLNLNSISYANEIDDTMEFSEGKTKQVLVNSYERNNEAREKCIEHFGLNCQVCDFNFQENFGELGNNFIHVHHKVDIATIGKEYIVNPITDLIPVCPNCHSMLHKRKPSYTIEELKNIMN